MKTKPRRNLFELPVPTADGDFLARYSETRTRRPGFSRYFSAVNRFAGGGESGKQLKVGPRCPQRAANVQGQTHFREFPRADLKIHAPAR